MILTEIDHEVRGMVELGDSWSGVVCMYVAPREMKWWGCVLQVQIGATMNTAGRGGWANKWKARRHSMLVHPISYLRYLT